jgi:hypothetical protein
MARSMADEMNESQVPAEDESAIQPTGERWVLFVIPTLLILLSAVGVGGTITLPRETFRGGCLVAFGGAFFLGCSMFICLWIAYRGRAMAEFHPNERFIPSVVAGCVFLVFLFFLNLLALRGDPPVLTGWEPLLLFLIFINGTLGIVWDVLVVRRSRLDGAWTGRRR